MNDPTGPSLTASPGWCPYCSTPGMGAWTYHSGACPKVKAIEYHPWGGIKRVEFHSAPVQWTTVPDDYPEHSERTQP